MDNFLSLRKTLFLFALLFSLPGWQSGAVAADQVNSQSSAEVSASININKASASEIAQALNGIGEAKAEAIVAYREQNGPFKSLEDLGNVKGVGEKTLEKNASKIAF